MLPQDWKQQFEAEVAQGFSARENGNEGRARVCARRAVAVLLVNYFNQRGTPPGKVDAYTVIQMAASDDGLPAVVREKLAHFLVRVEPGGRFPIDADLLSEAQWLAREISPGEDKPAG